jgi:hypothetical protein
MHPFAIFYPKTTPVSASFLRSIEAAAPSFAVKVTAARVDDVPEIERAITVAGREPNGGLIVPGDAFTTAHSELIVALAAQHRLPAVYPYRFFVRSGGLLSYSVDYFELFRQVGGGLHRSHPQGCEAGRPTRSNQILSLHQSKNREGTWPYGPTVAARPGRQGDRMTRQERRGARRSTPAARVSKACQILRRAVCRSRSVDPKHRILMRNACW